MTIPEILEVLTSCNFVKLTGDNFLDKIVDAIDDSIDLQYEYGATKGVLFFPDTDFVIKIPFLGYDEEEQVYDEEDDCYYSTENTFFTPFRYAEDGDAGEDYCKAEVLRYKRAKDEKLDDFFVETKLAGYVNSHPIYMQPICDIFSRQDITSISDEENEIINLIKEKNDFWIFNKRWMLDVLDIYGEDDLVKLCIFLREEHANDLHEDNIGYYKERPVLIDYAGFND